MSIWKEPTPVRKDPAPMPHDPGPPRDEDITPRASASFTSPPRARGGETRETVIAADLAIEGKIEGSGHVRVAGRFKGDIHVQGDLTIEPGAKVTGGVRAATVVIGGELEGNVDAAARVELLATGLLNGDLKAGSLTVAAGSRMRGQAEFGWDEKAQPGLKMELGAAS